MWISTDDHVVHMRAAFTKSATAIDSDEDANLDSSFSSRDSSAEKLTKPTKSKANAEVPVTEWNVFVMQPCWKLEKCTVAHFRPGLADHIVIQSKLTIPHPPVSVDDYRQLHDLVLSNYELFQDIGHRVNPYSAIFVRMNAQKKTSCLMKPVRDLSEFQLDSGSSIAFQRDAKVSWRNMVESIYFFYRIQKPHQSMSAWLTSQ